MPPTRIGPYRIEATLGRGGIGTVYRAIDRRSGEAVALKLLSAGPALQPTAALRLIREFETLAEINHPNIVRVIDTGVHEGYPYLAMELIDGLELRAWLSMDLSGSEEDGTTFLGLLSSSQERLAHPEDESWEDEGARPREPTASGERSRPFDLDGWADESDTHAGATERPAPASLSGVEALRALAHLANEPDTNDFEPGTTDPKLLGVASPPPRPSRARSSQLGELNRPERISRLKDAAQQLCTALAYIHGRGMIHRDLKPANVLVTEDRHVKLMDFGLAKFLAAEGGVTESRRIVGTYRYMAPEQAMGEKLDGRADLYSLGVVLFELLCGAPPFDARTPQELWRHVMEVEAPLPGTINPGADYTLAQVTHRLLQRDPEERYQTAEEVYDALLE